MVKRIPKTFKNPYSQSDISDKTKVVYNKKQKKYKIQHEEIITKINSKTKRKYDTSIKFNEDGNIRRIGKLNKLELTQKDKNNFVKKKYRLKDGSIKRIYTNIDTIETTTIYERKTNLKWQVIIKVYYKKEHTKKIFVKYFSSLMKIEPINYSKVKNEINRLRMIAEYTAHKSDFHILKIKSLIRYYDTTGGLHLKND